MTFGQKKSRFQGQKQWPPQFHIKFRKTGTPPLLRKIFLRNIFLLLPLMVKTTNAQCKTMRNWCWFIWFLYMPVGLFDIEMCDVVKMFVCNQKFIGICCRRGCKIISDQKWLGFVGEAAKSCYLDCPLTLAVVQSLQFCKKSDHNIYNFDNNLITLFIILTTIWSQNLKFLQQCDHNVYNFDNNIVAILFNFDSNLITIFVILTTIWSQYS